MVCLSDSVKKEKRRSETQWTGKFSHEKGIKETLE